MKKTGQLLLLCLFFYSPVIERGTSTDIQLQCSDITEYCLNEPVEYQCTVTGSIILTWRIRDETMTTLDTVSYTTNDAPGSFSPIPDVPQFSTDLSSTTPSIVSNISFTVQSSINGYTIHCEDAGGDTPNCTINIADAPPPPTNVTIEYNHIEDEVFINWTLPSYTSQCIANYTVITNATNSTIISTTNTTSSTITSTTITSTTDTTSVTIPLAGLSPGIYCVSVASVDTANRTGTYSEEECLQLNVPPEPSVRFNSSAYLPNQVMLGVMFNNSVYPFVTAVHINANSTHYRIPYEKPNQAIFEFNMSIAGYMPYNITAFGENRLGNGSQADLVISVSRRPAVSPSTVILSSIVSSVNTTATTTSLLDESRSMRKTDTLKGTIIIAVIAGAVVVAVMIITVVVITVLLRRRRKSSKSKNISSNTMVGIKWNQRRDELVDNYLFPMYLTYISWN